MSLGGIILLGIAVSLDAFSVALSIGLNNQVRKNNKIGFILSFSFFQFFCSFIGAYVGYIFSSFAAIPSLIGGAIISIIGVMIVKEGMEEKDEGILLKKRMWLILGVSVSIDAMVVGFVTLNSLGSLIFILGSTLIIGAICLVMVTVAFIITRYLKRIKALRQYADYIGGAILILFGIKMMFLG